MLRRAIFIAMVLAVPLQAQAQGYVVRAGDTLTAIAGRYHVSLGSLARLNSIRNVNLIEIGRVIFIPQRMHSFYYRVHWGDTLIGIGARYGLTLTQIRALNPRLGPYPLAGQWLRLCGPCGGSAGTGSSTVSSVAGTGHEYFVHAGDTLSSVASTLGVSMAALMDTNHLASPNLIYAGQRLEVPQYSAGSYDPWGARGLITSYAHSYGVDPSLALAIGWQESGFNQNVVSSTGAVGVMQVEPYTANHIAAQWGRPVNLTSLDDNVHAGVYWLSRLLTYYGGDERLATAAYYQGTHSIAKVGFFDDTKQYVANVLSLQSSFGG